MYKVVVDDIEWLRKLQNDLWPSKPKPERSLFNRRSDGDDITIKLEAKRTLTKEEFERVLGSIEKHKLIAEMFSTSMFGGYGMKLYDHELYPGTGAQFLVSLIEDHLPVATRYDHISGNLPEEPKRRGQGCGREDAWKVFSKFTHAEQNVEWLTKYRLQPSQYQSYYDY